MKVQRFSRVVAALATVVGALAATAAAHPTEAVGSRSPLVATPIDSTPTSTSTSVSTSTSSPPTTPPPTTTTPPTTYLPPTTSVAAPPDAATSGSLVIAASPATRETAHRPEGAKLLFPMDPKPKCDVLDNFGDPRSGGRSHEGTDILATLGQAVYAVDSGTITTKTAVGAPNASLSGNSLVVTRGDRTYFMYAHLSAFAPGIERGSRVASGQLIGYVGDTGNPGAGNNHLHFEVHPGGADAVNAVALLDIPTACKVY